ncbi:ATP-dependent zinc metalloprotease FtsH [Spirochaeta isovalerica]|uniref:ATP-dependent zinc metalloprotease FtsH n=1 Tax=Spirochaeta isovalerica TaxID=150 RepID=A0A841R732_9SPIO|nr:ATP-dependent zinc metalloprotease FtsH [Spirochaeta isovalerica]MBB6479017.1 cell division protease FtsH [Spirochaeta isovalerica]
MNDDKNNKDPNDFFDNNNKYALFFLFSLVTLFLFVFSFSDTSTINEISYSLFYQQLGQGNVREIEILDQREIFGTFVDRTGAVTSFKTKIPYYDEQLMEDVKDKGVEVSGGAQKIGIGTIVMQILPWLLMFVFIWWMFRSVQGGSGGGKAFSFGKSKARKYEKDNNPITFTDVAGQLEAKYELQEVVEFLKNPTRFTSIGAKIPKGVLLVGSPGTGKTLLAKAVAGEAGVAFFHMSGSDFVEMFVGVGASRVRDLFETGRKNAPCILFIDEIDAVGRTRGAGYGGGHDEREQTLNQLLVEMDGFDTQEGVIIIAATNRPDVLDPALLRPGRFDRQVVVDLPDVKEREAILKIHSRKINLGDSVDLNIIARATPGSSGADIANIVNEAALFAARRKKELVEMVDFEEASDKVLMGVARTSRVFSDAERKMTAYHEAGHALLHYYLKNADPIHKVTIIPRGRALGVTFSLPEEDKYSRSSGWIYDRIKICYGGFAAEELIYGETSSGAQNDLEQATDLARKMVCDWGMSAELGPVSYGQNDEPIFIGKEIAQHKDYSDQTASLIDREIKRILQSSLDEVRTLLKKHRDELERLTEILLEKETLDDKEIRELLEIPLNGEK